MDYIVHGILQARILEWVAFSRWSSQPRDRTQVSCIAGRFFTSWATKEALNGLYKFFNLEKWQESLCFKTQESIELHQSLEDLFDPICYTDFPYV